jgi:CheY-like chemotaxis protein
MVHGFVMQSGGALLLSSQPGAGTNVELWLPRTIETAHKTDESDSSVIRAASAVSRSLRILLVDDDPLVVAGTIGMLEELGHHAICAAASGEEALAVLRHDGDFDLLLSDYMMPGMTGVQLATQVRELLPSLPVLLASGFAEIDGLATTKWPRLRKPYSLSELSAALALFQPRGTR